MQSGDQRAIQHKTSPLQTLHVHRAPALSIPHKERERASERERERVYQQTSMHGMNDRVYVCVSVFV